MSAAVDSVLAALAARGTQCHKSGQGWLAHCPAHEDKTPSLSISEGHDGRALLKCFAGCTAESIVAALGLAMTDLFNDPPKTARCEAPRLMKGGQPIQSPSPQTFEQFCAARRLDAARLASRWRVKEDSFHGRPCLRYPTVLKVDRLKFLDGGKPKYLWGGKGGHAHWYGMGGAKGHGGPVLYIVNGEPSVWGCDAEAVPAVSPCGEGAAPGANLVQELRESGFKRFAVVYDLDPAGRRGALATVKALREAGLDAVALALPSSLGPHGDVDDLHRREGAGLKAALEALPPLPEPMPAGPVTKQFSTVEPEEVSWLWEPYIPKGKLVLFQGDPTAGKTWAALALAARLTKQGHKVIYASLEDGVADTLRPRAEKVGADLTKLVALTGRREEDGTERPLSLADVSDIETAIIREAPVLLVLDPISAWLQGADMNKANEVRGKLTPMVRLAEKYSVTVLLLQHLTKARTDRAIYRGSGSIDFVAACRSALLFGETQGGQRAMVQIKNSFALLGKSVGYSIGEDGFSWTGELDLKASDLLQGEASPEEQGANDDAAEWLRSELASGPQEAGPLQQRFERETGHNRRTLRRAFKSMGGRREKDDFSAGWKWALDEGDTKETKGTGTQKLVPLGDTPATKGFEGNRSAQGDTEKRVCPLGEGDTKETKGTGTHKLVPLGEPTPLKGLEGKGSTEGDRDPEACPLGRDAVPYAGDGAMDPRELKKLQLEHPELFGEGESPYPDKV